MRDHLRLLALIPLLTALLPATEIDDTPAPKSAGDEKDFLASLTTLTGYKPTVWASGTQVMNAVAIDVDERGRLFAAETGRWRSGGVIDVREYMFLYKDDLQVKTIADRRAMIEKWKDKFSKDFFTKESERIKLVEDTDGDGRADRSTVWADGFNDAVDGPAAGILLLNGTAFFADIPKVYALTDRSGKGVADTRTVLADGFGPRFSISGHDLHGLAMGPDGRLYFSMGDRGYDLATKEGAKFAEPRSGGVFRCDPDGSHLEPYYLGLRNPQELAFNADGDLFTVDNNSDMGDQSRLVYILEGGTSGWNHGWQLLGNDGFARAGGLEGRQPNPWLEEGLWKQPFPHQPAWVMPASGLITSGPSGVAFCPSSSYGDQLTGHFLVCDFRAGTESGVWSFKPVAAGAGFALPEKSREKFLWGLPPSDVTFGYNGTVYVADWIGGWVKNDRGRIIAINETTPGPRQAATAAVATLAAAGFAKRPVAELATLLGHDDLRIRQHAQFELVRRGAEGRQALAAAAAAASGTPVFARLHGIWGLGQLARADATAAQPLVALLADPEARVREQAAKTLGDLRFAPAAAPLAGLLADTSARAQAFAAIALGRLRSAAAVPALTKLLKDTADKDPFLRHAAVMGLAGAAPAASLVALATDPSPAVRMGAVLTLRRTADPGIASFLDDGDLDVRVEAIRAIYDLGIEPAMPKLIAQLAKPLGGGLPDTIEKLVYLRLINAAYRYGGPDAAVALTDFAAGTTAPAESRAAALKAVANWKNQSWVDPVIGFPRPVTAHAQDPDPAKLKDGIVKIIVREDELLLGTAVRLAQANGYGVPDKSLLGILANTGMPGDIRAEALNQLAQRKNKDLPAKLPPLLRDENGAIRSAAFDALLSIDPRAGVEAAKSALLDDGTADREVAVVTDRSDAAWEELTMGAPDKALDLARGRTVAWIDIFSKPNPGSGAQGQRLPRLTDGELAQNDDDTGRCSWFDENEGRFVLDLEQPTEIGRIDTWSWHKGNHAQQDFILWGSNADSLPNAGGANPASAWTRIARPSTIALGDGGKHGSSVLNPRGSLGTFRWLMWQTLRKGTFFTELAVYAPGKTPSGLVHALTDRSTGGWDELAMRAPAAAGKSLAATATWVAGFPKPTGASGASGQALPRLLAGDLPTTADDAKHSVAFEKNDGRILLDLGKPQELTRVSTYSWQKGDRADQSFSLWASAAATAPDAGGKGAKELSGAGWKRLATVDTAGTSTGGKHGSAVEAIGATLGSWRWLLWQNNARKSGATFFSHIDVFAAGGDLPPIRRRPSAANIQLKQHVLATLGSLADPAAPSLLAEWLDRLLAGTVPAEVQLELTTAAAARKEPEIAERLARWKKSLAANDPLAPYRIALAGGDATKGHDLFRFHLAQCIKCHSVDKEGGNAGPDLKGVGNRLSHEEILQSMIVPSAVVVAGFGQGSVKLTDGTTVYGAFLSQSEKETVVRTGDGKETTIPAAKIASVSPPISPMPPMGYLLSPPEIRDLVAYLSSLK